MGHDVTIQASDGHSLGAYRAEPDRAPIGGLVVIQEIFGVNRHIRSVVDRFAADGYVAIAPALFDRVRTGVELDYDPDGVQAGFAVMQELDLDQVMLDLRAAVDAVADVGRVGVVGYCFGGSMAARASIEMADVVSCAVGYYGGGVAQLVERRPQIPLLLHFGAEDHAIPAETVDAVRQAWPEVPVHVYPGAGHGFNCDLRASYHPASAALALERTLAFLAANLS